MSHTDEESDIMTDTVSPPHKLFNFSTHTKEKNVPFQPNLDFFDKTINIVVVYMLERFIEREFRKKLNIPNPKFEQDFFESMQNIIIYINLKLIKPSDITVEYGEIKKINKIIMKDGVFVYDIENYPISCKRIKRINNREKTNSKLKRILATRVYFE
jgi:hypothetical protein